MSDACRLSETVLRSGHRAVTLENGSVAATLLPEKGAEIYSLVYKPRAMDVLWKSPWGLTQRVSGLAFAGGNTEAAWMDQYGGGWQEIFPNGGDECVYKNAPLNFHGEASIQSWDYKVQSRDSSCVAVEFTVALRRSPFRIRRTVIVERNLAGIQIQESIANHSEEDLHYMWGHHPALGDPFLSGDCVLRVPARTFLNHSVEISPHTRLHAGARAVAGGGRKGRPAGRPLEGFRKFTRSCNGIWVHLRSGRGWYGMASRQHGFGFGLAWPRDVFPYLWFWQELRGSLGYPWYGRCRVMAVEPFSSIPGSGLISAINAGTAPVLRAGARVQANLAAIFYEAQQGDLRSISTSAIAKFQASAG
jgi:hypothetical protein